MASPVVPQRPARSQQLAPSLSAEMPTIPPRPARTTKSRSRSRDNYARSPLNESPFANHIPPTSLHPSAGEHPRLDRPPSVQVLPLVGQEGDEYASLENLHSAAAAPNVTSNVAGDLPLHAPKASVPAALAKTQISTVTHTDAVSAAAAGIGKPHYEAEEPDRSYRPPSAKPYSARPPSSYSNERPGSTPRALSIGDGEGNEHGIPAIGLQVPMNPFAGDVQAPSPGPASHGPATGVGFFNDGRHGAQLSRRKSRDVFAARPPDAYGLHGHGNAPADQFERAWYQRHPEEAHKEEHGAYGPGAHQGRGLWALSSEDLNKLVHSKGAGGMATTPTAIGIPPESIGYMASEEYASRMSSPRPPSVHSKSRTGSQTYAESPLRQTSHEQGDYIGSPTTGKFARAPSTDGAIDSELEDDIIHLNAPNRRSGKYTGNGYDPPVEDLGAHGGNTDEHGGWINERGYGVPILASDEIAKDPTAEYMLPAVDPEQEQRGEHYYDFEHYSAHAGAWRSGPSSRPGSRPSSRPGSVHGAPISLSRFVSRDEHDKAGTPLEEIEEYEPLFGDEDTAAQKRPVKLTDRFKRPDLELHRFPSSDIWEDTPNSLQLQTTVDSEQAPEERAIPVAPAAAVFESPEKEHMRAGKVTEHQRQKSSVDSSYRHRFKAGVQEEMATRPGLAPRFPSQDIWEDTPDSAMMQTTVGDSPADDPPVASSQAAAIATAPIATAAAGVVVQPQEVHVSAASEKTQPTIPARPVRTRDIPASEEGEPLTQTKSAERNAPPTIPGRPKPQIPARPPRSKFSPPGAAPDDASYLTTSPPKPKPAVPARPAQGKLANLKPGFMDTLNSRLSKGPPVAPVPQPRSAEEEDEQPRAPISLSDARKGRARGPVRRRPAGDTTAGAKPASPWGMSKLSHVWSIPPEGVLAVSSGAEADAVESSEDKVLDVGAAAATAPSAVEPESEPGLESATDAAVPTAKEVEPQDKAAPEEISTASLTSTDATADAITHIAADAKAEVSVDTATTIVNDNASEVKGLPEEVSTASVAEH